MQFANNSTKRMNLLENIAIFILIIQVNVLAKFLTAGEIMNRLFLWLMLRKEFKQDTEL